MVKKNFQDNSLLFSGNEFFVEELYEKFLKDPVNVDKSWRDFFISMGDNPEDGMRYVNRAAWTKKKSSIIGVVDKSEQQKSVPKPTVDNSYIEFNTRLLLEKYRSIGHLLSNLDPLGLEIRASKEELKLDLVTNGITKADLDKKVSLTDYKIFKQEMLISDFVKKLDEVYCADIGYEFAHIASQEQKNWLYNKVEESSYLSFSDKEKKKALQDLIEVEAFEQFIHTRFPGAKRFSVEGADTSIIAILEIIKIARKSSNVGEIIIGMSHRGRLNVLTKIMHKSYKEIFSEFHGVLPFAQADLFVSGDVKYHSGKSSKYSLDDDDSVLLSLTSNPSHLEAVNPVAQGKVRAKQDLIDDVSREKVMGLLIHGDAAFTGQGVVAEALSLGDLEGYDTGGTMHVIVNNQIGFTTLPKEARTSRYPTEFAKIIQAPVIHVNSDNPEAVLKVARIAEEFRHKFKKDVVIDIVAYRRYGHNEGDEPMFTQPKMYHKIKDQKTVACLYEDKLVAQNLIKREDAVEYRKSFVKNLDTAFEDAKKYKSTSADWLEGRWSDMRRYDRDNVPVQKTGVETKDLQEIGKALVSCPDNFNLNPKVQRLLATKQEMFKTGKGFDWATAEALAFGSLLTQDVMIRFSGQDVKRGTFSHRHAVFFDQNTQQEYIPVNNVKAKQKKLSIYNSNLSEYAVLGFEYGYSVVDPDVLTLWEAQFGDFSNGAQIIIDQFISSAEYKWLRMSGLVMLLPHGHEGQGPEHTSARLERYLQLCAEHNMQVVNCTTPANYFHVLRRQVIDRKYRKPLVVMSPKSLLRHKMAVSDLSEMSKDTTFKAIIVDDLKVAKKDIQKVVICSGKIYYDLIAEREAKNINNIAIIRVEQYYPFPDKELQIILKQYNKNAKFVWCQEEPRNMGAWSFVCHYLDDILKKIGTNGNMEYVGRIKSASPATGYLKVHLAEQQEILDNIFGNKK
jgi:2-oxoglutarate dehydrogenase E1 component